jgi:hypothetical protein
VTVRAADCGYPAIPTGGDVPVRHFGQANSSPDLLASGRSAGRPPPGTGSSLAVCFWPFVEVIAYNYHMDEILTPIRAEAADDPGGLHDHRLYGLAAEIRAVEEGHNARVLPDGSILVKSDSQAGSYRVFIRGIADGVLRFGCSCRSGQYRTALPVPCKHAALAARRLEREGLARWEDGTWRLRDRAQVRGVRLLLSGTVRPRQRATAA